MATRSSANFISYDLRPTKQTERRILLEVLRGASKHIPLLKTFRYVGMGANRFYDFLLMHKYLGVSEMISLEHDANMHRRAKFNCPYGFIDVVNKSTSDLIAENSFEKNSIVWFDYDGGLSSTIIEDISSLGRKLPTGGFFFVTTYGGFPGAVEKQPAAERLEWIEEILGDGAAGVSLADVEKATAHIAIYKTLITAFKTSFAYRRDGIFVPLLCVKYSDSKPMVTVGGGFFDTAKVQDVKDDVHASLPFLDIKNEALYEIRSLYLTEKERTLFDRAVTSPVERSRNVELQLTSFGFNKEDISAYRELVRFHPRYVESIV